MERSVWSETLVNQIAPEQALIRNDGEFVITVGEFRRGGASHALVIYDENGQPLREFGLRELLQRDDWQHVVVRERAVIWLENAAFAFEDDAPQFAISLEWGRVIRIDLEKLQVIDGPATASAPADGAGRDADAVADAQSDQGIPPEILALLDSFANGTATADADAATAADAQHSEVQQALQNLQSMAEASGVELPRDAADTSADEIPADTGEAERIASMPNDEQPPRSRIAGNSATAGVPVPAPDPADPIDYVEWLRTQTTPDGPDAAPLYATAMDQMVPWEGDEELHNAAERGELEALLSPEIGDWIAANEAALESYHAATLLEYRGFFVDSEDGSLIGILLPNLSKQRALAKVENVKARRLEALGDLDGAMNCYVDALAAGTQSGQGATLIENLVGAAVQALSSENMLSTFERDTDFTVDYAALADRLDQRYGALRPSAETFQYERAMVLDVAQRVFEWNPDSERYRVSESGLDFLSSSWGIIGDTAPSRMVVSFVLGAKGFEGMTSQVNRHYDDLTAAAQLPFQEGQVAMSEIEERISSPAFRFGNPIISQLLPSLSRATYINVRSESQRRATTLVAHLRAYRQQYGTYPDSLDEFEDATYTIDPLSDSRFMYTRDGDNFRLYSVGKNGIDDGGIQGTRYGEDNDNVFWPRPVRE